LPLSPEPRSGFAAVFPAGMLVRNGVVYVAVEQSAGIVVPKSVA
jgi:hypothetical protein